MRPFNGIKTQDIAILLKLVALGDSPWRHIDIAGALGLSQTKISFALDRCLTAGFIDTDKKTVIKPALAEFLLHGLKYVFPAKPGPICRGIPTAHSAPPLARVIVATNEDHYVWASEGGRVRGQAIEPLCPKAAAAAKADTRFYELLALTDALRSGRHREHALAVRELEARLNKAAQTAPKDGATDELPFDWHANGASPAKASSPEPGP